MNCLNFAFLFVTVDHSHTISDDAEDSDEDERDVPLDDESLAAENSYFNMSNESVVKMKKLKLLTNTPQAIKKRSRIENAASSIVVGNNTNNNESLSSILKEVNHNSLCFRKQITAVMESCDRHKKINIKHKFT